MNKFKAIFVSSFFGFVLGAAIYTVYQLWYGGIPFIWGANALTISVVLAYMGGIFLIDIPRTSKHMVLVLVPMLIGSLQVVYATFGLGVRPLTAFYLNFGVVMTWLFYIYWATDFSDRDQSVLQVGKPMPNASLKNADGEKVELARFFKTPTVFLFYRGNWCPFCMAQIKELAAQYREIEAKGAQLVFISPQSPRHTKSLAQKMNIPATFLLDEDLSASKSLTVFSESGTPFGMEILGYTSDNVLPTLIVTDAKGIIRFADLTDNYRMRPEPETYLKILEDTLIVE